MIFIKLFLLKLTQSPVFIIVVKEGSILKKEGRVNNGFVQDCKEIMKANCITHCVIYGVAKSQRNTLIKAWGTVSKDALQQMRNVWQFYR